MSRTTMNMYLLLIGSKSPEMYLQIVGVYLHLLETESTESALANTLHQCLQANLDHTR